MIERDDIDGLAAEYALGSLSLAERREVDARRRQDAALDAAVVEWERRLAPLSDAVPGIDPPAGLFARITDRLDKQSRQPAEVVALSSMRRNAGPWRALAVGTSALAACLVLTLVWLLVKPVNSPSATLVAVLHRSTTGSTADEGSGARGAPAFVVTVDLKARTIIVNPVSVRPTARRGYELWLVRTETAAPASLGMISQSEPTTVPWRARYPPDDFVSGTIAVSLEPEGGSPTGAPTGPIIFSGKLVQSLQ